MTPQPEWTAEKYARWDAYTDNIAQAIYDLYGGVLPEYVIEKETNEDEFTVDIDDGLDIETHHITVGNVCDYYAYRDRSGLGVLADIVGDWRMIDGLAQEAFDWFKAVNREELAKACDKRGMLIDLKGD
jgi:hypothetical protein